MADHDIAEPALVDTAPGVEFSSLDCQLAIEFCRRNEPIRERGRLSMTFAVNNELRRGPVDLQSEGPVVKPRHRLRGRRVEPPPQRPVMTLHCVRAHAVRRSGPA
jgi:hypothetical protein